MRSVRSNRFFRRFSWLEPFLFVALILVYIWEIQPSGLIGNLAGFIILACLPLISQILHRERPRDLGFRWDNLGGSAREVGAMTIIAIAVVVLAGILAEGAPRITWAVFLEVGTYPLWALGQQYALQSFVFRRLRARWGTNRAAAISAFLFSALHYPNPVLVVATAIAGYAWCRLYNRKPNLYTLAVSHGVLAMMVLNLLPPQWTHGLKVGPGYYLWVGSAAER